MIFLKLLSPMGIDFRVYYESAWLILHGGNPYHGILSTTFPLNYPPPVFFFIWPLGLFSMAVAGPIWNILSTLAVIASIYLVLKITRGFTALRLIIFTLLFTIFYFPVKFNIGNGQINHFILFFSVLGLYWYDRGRKLLGPLSLAFAAAIKLAPGIFVLYFLIKKDWRAAGLTGLFFVGFYLLPFLFFSWDFQKRYYTEIFFYSFTLGAKDWYYNQSLFGLLARSFSNPLIIQAGFYILAAVILLVTFLRCRKISSRRALSAVAALYLVIHPIALQHYFGFALVPFILLATEVEREMWRLPTFLFFAAAFLLLAGNIAVPLAVPKEFNLILSHQFLGIFFLWLWALFRETFWEKAAILWSAAVVFNYLIFLLCRAKICF